MGETEKLVKAPENGQHMSLLAKLSSWFTGLKAEFIALLDFAIQYGVDFLVGLSF